MKTLLRLIGLFFAPMLVARGAETAPLPFPSELHLTNGAVLRQAKPEKWTSDSVTVRYVGGLAPIRFINIAEPDRAAVIAARTAAVKPPEPGTVAAEAQAPKSSTISGQAFVVTRGAGNYKLGGMTVRVFPIETWSDSTNGRWDMGKPLAVGTTDADGQFKITLVKDEPFFLYARGAREVSGQRGLEMERHQWIVKSVDIGDRTRVILSSNNEDRRNVTVDFQDP